MLCRNQCSFLQGNCNIPAIQPLTRAASTDQRLYFLCLSIDWEAEQREGFWINFSFPKGLQMKCQPSAPLHKRAFEQKEPKSLQYSGNQKFTIYVPKTPQNIVFHSWVRYLQIVWNQYWLNLLIFKSTGNGGAIRRSQEESRTVRVMRGAATPAFLLAFSVVVDEYRDREPVAHKCFIRQAAVFMEWFSSIKTIKLRCKLFYFLPLLKTCKVAKLCNIQARIPLWRP